MGRILKWELLERFPDPFCKQFGSDVPPEDFNFYLKTLISAYADGVHIWTGSLFDYVRDNQFQDSIVDFCNGLKKKNKVEDHDVSGHFVLIKERPSTITKKKFLETCIDFEDAYSPNFMYKFFEQLPLEEILFDMRTMVTVWHNGRYKHVGSILDFLWAIFSGRVDGLSREYNEQGHILVPMASRLRELLKRVKTTDRIEEQNELGYFVVEEITEVYDVQ